MPFTSFIYLRKGRGHSQGNMDDCTVSFTCYNMYMSHDGP